MAVSPARTQGPDDAPGDPLIVVREAMLGAGAKGRHAAIVRGLEVPVPFDLGQFVAGLERQRDRPIRLRPFTSGPGVPCGLWIGTADADYERRQLVVVEREG